MDKSIGLGAYYESSSVVDGQTVKKFNATIKYGNEFSRLDATSFKELERKIIKKTTEIMRDEDNTRKD